MKRDISKRKMPFFCILKGLPNKQKITSIVVRIGQQKKEKMKCCGYKHRKTPQFLVDERAA